MQTAMEEEQQQQQEEEEEYESNEFSFHTRNVVDDNTALKQLNFTSQKIETKKNLKEWLLFDTASTTNLIANKKLVKNVRFKEQSDIVEGTGGRSEIKEEGDMNGLGVVPVASDGFANILAMAALVRQGFRIIADTAVEDAIFVETPDGKRRLKFEPSKNGLYYHDTRN